MKRFSTLMYHALYANEEELSLIDQEDRPYAISMSEFCAQLDLLNSNNIDVLSPEEVFKATSDEFKNSSVLLTFDDGHSSFYHHAYPELKKRNMSAIFFITTDLIDKKQEFCDWSQLKEMHESGMSIQSHGKTHKFISDLDAESAFTELQLSKNIIEKNVGNNVTSISFPGGRYQGRDIANGLRAGYKLFFTSDIGTGIKGKHQNIIPRLALKGATSRNKFLLLARGNTIEIYKQKIINGLKKILKLIVGNRLYHELYRRIATR